MKAYGKMMVLPLPFHVFLFMTTEKDSRTQHTKLAIKVLFHQVSLATLIADHKVCGSKGLCQRSCAELQLT